MATDFKFEAPPEAPTFRPSEEDFADPLAYINRIRPVAEKYGICKIKPPPDWAPPFAVDVDKFKFTPRVQKINELEAITRIKLNFLDQISKFWELQGTSLRIPLLGNKALDLYTLHQLVHTIEFQSSKLPDEKKWNMIATRMGLQSNGKLGVSVGFQLKAHYERILYPYDVWKSNQGKKKAESPRKGNGKGKTGSRMGGGKSKTDRYDPLANYICQNCKGGEDEEKMLLCDGCDDSYHTFCLKPPLEDVPKGEWRCPDCLEEKLSKPIDGFGFEQAQKEYTLQTFGEMADTFKSDYFNMPVHLVSTGVVEREFWRIVSAIDEDVTVEYGADLHTMDHGSGFPTVPQPKKKDCDEMYIESGWNLNKLPVLNGSVFAHINADISGMKVPWMYVGMCFSTFCWHNEDHWSYSINYLHWGEPKTWYGVPGGKADDFENAMKSAAPELFAQAPDLLHQLVTIMNPNILMKANVPVFRMDQKAGEFIITFPRAYHAGFNQGYNFAEAVNFAPADWVPMGRECVQHYSKLNRFCVFSHDELVCAMAAQPEKLDTSIALATYQDIVKMFEAEKEQRKDVHTWGVKSSEYAEFEHLQDDGRQCNVCKTTLFLSAIACVHGRGTMKDSKLVCLKHYDQYGCKECKKDPANHIMKYRYTIDDLQKMISGLKERVGGYEKWVTELTAGLSANDEEQKLSLEQLRDFVEAAKKYDFPESEVLTTARQILEEAERVQKIAKELIGTPAVRTRKGGASDIKFKCNMEELESLALEMDHLRVTLTEKVHCVALYVKAKQLQDKTKRLLNSSTASIDEMSKCIQEATSLDVGFEELHSLRHKFEREKWLRLANSDDDEGSVWTMDYLKKIIDEGNDIRRNDAAERKMEELCQLAEQAAIWEAKATRILTCKYIEKFDMRSVKDLISLGQDIPVALPSLPSLREIITKATNWLDKVKHYESPNVPFLDDLVSLVETGLALPIRLDHIMALESQISAANTWREECMRVFLKRNSHVELFEALTPRRSIPEIPQRGKKRRLMVDGPSLTFVANVLGIPHPDVKSESLLAAAYRKNITLEIDSINALRKLNRNKSLPENCEEAKFCVCQKPKDDTFMIRCELCLEWFHPTCVPLPRIAESDEMIDPLDEGVDSQARIAYKIAHRETKYLGPCCSRSRRPEYSVILNLLVGLKKLPLHMVEGVALQCLTDRAMKWQEECDNVLQIPEVKGAFENIKSRIYFMSIYSSKKSLDGVDEVDPSTQKMFFDANLSFSPQDTPGFLDDSKSNGVSKMDASTLSDNSSRDKEVDVAMILAGMDKEVFRPEITHQTITSETPSDTTRGTHGDSSNPVDKTPIVDTLPRLQLKPEIIKRIEDLLVEADLMELTAEESDILWKIYDMANPTVYEKRDLIEVQRLIREELSIKGLTLFDKRGTSRKRKQSANDDSRNKKSPRRNRIMPDSPSKPVANQENDEDCAAAKCKQPVGKEVTWVQCDGCDRWFHVACIGVKKSIVMNLDTYTCIICEATKPKVPACDVEDGSSCDTDSKLSSSGKLSISSNKENTNGANDASGEPDCMAAVKEEKDSIEFQERDYASNSLGVFSKVNGNSA